MSARFLWLQSDLLRKSALGVPMSDHLSNIGYTETFSFL